MTAIRTGAFLSINGQEQWVTVRGDDVRNPPVLIVGGPGAALSTFAPLFASWERELTLVQWDAPGAGSTAARNGDAGLEPFTLERLTADLAAVASAFAQRFDRRPLLLAFSAGSVLGLTLAARRPEVVEAYVGCGQIVHWDRQQALGYRTVLDRARANGNAEATVALEQIGPPPWASIDDEVVASTYLNAPTAAEQAALASLDPAVLAALGSPPADADYVAPGVQLDDPRSRATALYDRLRPEIRAFDAWRLARKFNVPVFFLQGAEDTYMATAEVERYVADVRAPHAELVVIPRAGHAALCLRDELLRLLTDVVLARLGEDVTR